MPPLTQIWKNWRYATSNDTLPTTLKPTGLSKPRNEQSALGVITPRGSDSIMLRAFGTDAEDDTVTLTIIAWADNGPGVMIASIAAILGASSFTEPFLESSPDLSKAPPSSTTFFEADTYVIDPNLVGATTPTIGAQGAGRVSSFVIVPMLGFPHLQLFITGLAAQGTPAASAGVIWKPLDITRGW